MENETRALTVNTFDDLLNMNANMHDNIRKLTVKYADCKSSIRHVCDILAALHKLEWLEIQNPDGRFCTINGILYSRNGKSLYFCPRQREGSMRIQDGTEVICENAFNITNISELIIPDSVKRIQKFACGYNDVLERVIGGKGIKDNGEVSHITPDKMYDIHLPVSLKEIGRAAFCNAANIYTKEANLNAVRAGIRSSGASLGHGCDFWKLHIDGLQPIVMPKEVDSINVIARRVRLYTKGETTSPPETYSESRLATKYTTALEHRKLYPGKDVDEFLNENIKKVFAFTIAEKDGERLMTEYIKSGMFTDEALQSLIEHIEKSNDFSDNASKYTALKAYALQAMKPSQDIFEI